MLNNLNSCYSNSYFIVGLRRINDFEKTNFISLFVFNQHLIQKYLWNVNENLCECFLLHLDFFWHWQKSNFFYLVNNKM